MRAMNAQPAMVLQQYPPPPVGGAYQYPPPDGQAYNHYQPPPNESGNAYYPPPSSPPPQNMYNSQSPAPAYSAKSDHPAQPGDYNHDQVNASYNTAGQPAYDNSVQGHSSPGQGFAMPDPAHYQQPDNQYNQYKPNHG